MILPTLRQLEYFVAIVDEGGFSRAAEACLVTQPALSSQMQQLERLLGVQLLERGGRKLLLTQAGRTLLPRARAALHEVQELVSAASAAGGTLQGDLRLGVIPTIAPYLLPAVLPAVQQRYPQLRLLLSEARTSELVRELHTGRLDLLLLALDTELHGATVFELFDEDFLLALPDNHALAGREQVQEDDLEGLDLLLLDDGHCLRDHALAACGAAAGQAHGDFRGSSLNTLVRMVAGGIGVTLLPQMAAATEVRSEDPIALVPLASTRPGRRIGLAWRPHSAREEDFRLLAIELKRAH